MSPNERLQQLAQAGVSVWLDDLSRDRLTSGNLAGLISSHSVVGVTTNPSIFQNAIAGGAAYADQVAQQAAAGATAEEAVFAMTTADVSAACDVMAEVFRASDGIDGRVSIEVDPRLARDTDGTVAAAKQLWAAVDRPNAMIKIPATEEGLPAITATLAAGISVNVTLIFSIERYRAVANAYLSGLEQARENGHDLSGIKSVASFFVSRVDSEVDPRLDALGTEEASRLRGKIATANARAAYRAYQEIFTTSRWQTLAEEGATEQRCLWASTSTKDPDMPDTTYVDDLVAPNTVNTMPEKTLMAFADHGSVDTDAVTGHLESSVAELDALEGLGIGYTDVTDRLEREGLEKFEQAWVALLTDVDAAMAKAVTS